MVLPDGRHGQLHIRTGPDWTVVISDGGFTTEQLAIFSGFEDQARARYAKRAEPARQFKLEYSGGELRFLASDLDDALRRVPSLARVKVAAIAMIMPS